MADKKSETTILKEQNAQLREQNLQQQMQVGRLMSQNGQLVVERAQLAQQLEALNVDGPSPAPDEPQTENRPTRRKHAAAGKKAVNKALAAAN